MIPKIEIQFKITGSFDSEEFTKEIGLKPTHVWRAGDSVQKTLITRKTDGWRISIAEKSSYDLDVEINNLILLLAPFKLSIIDFCNRKKLKAEFSCIITTEDNEFPSMHFGKGLLEEVLDYNAEIDIDIY